jgi:hypothetical protein
MSTGMINKSVFELIDNGKLFKIGNLNALKA